MLQTNKMAYYSCLTRELRKYVRILVALGVAFVVILNVYMSLNVYEQLKPSKNFKSTIAIGNITDHIRTMEVRTDLVDNRLPNFVAGLSTHKEHVREKIKHRTKKTKHQGSCSDYKIREKFKVRGNSADITCQQHQASEEACQFAADAYAFDATLLECKNGSSVQFCSLKHSNKLTCSFPSQCQRIIVHGLDKTRGVLQVKGKFSNLQSLELGLAKIIKVLSIEGFRFVFIECASSGMKITTPRQLLTWGPTSGHKANGPNQPINVNIVLLDSISRAHFYRSLPVVIDEFERQNEDTSGGAEVLDFSSFQSVHGHSAENFHALFTGQLFPETIVEEEREAAPVGIDTFFRAFKSAGYQTMYHEDLCWKYVWGLRMELGTPKNWRALLSSIDQSYIDDTGMIRM